MCRRLKIDVTAMKRASDTVGLRGTGGGNRVTAITLLPFAGLDRTGTDMDLKLLIILMQKKVDYEEYSKCVYLPVTHSSPFGFWYRIITIHVPCVWKLKLT